MSVCSSVALGFFDGVHIAHKKIIEKAVSYAKEHGLRPVALTFDLSPAELLKNGFCEYITPNSQKIQIIEALGAEVLMLPLTKELLNMNAEDFIKTYVLEMLNAKYVVCGYNYRFGKDAAGDTDLLKKMGERCGFGVFTERKISVKETDVSSSMVRTLLSKGNVEAAAKLLGRCFEIFGTVEHGRQLGRTLGFPTANVAYPQKTVHLRAGVYKTRVFACGKYYRAITNVGKNPTVGGSVFRTESYLCGYHGDLYNENIKIEFESFIRPEMTFKSTEELKKQILSDIKRTEENL